MGKIAFVFPGQGSQIVGMGKDFYENIEESKKIFDEANNILNFDIKKLCFEGPKNELDITENTQPALLTCSIAILKAVESLNIKPDVVAGLSLGEYSALVCSGAIEFKDALPLVKKRGWLMQNAVPIGQGGMAAILGLESKKVESICTELKDLGCIEIANFNCPGQIVIGGQINLVDTAIEMALNLGAKRAIKLSVSAPFHTSMLKGIQKKFSDELKNVKIEKNRVPVVTNVDAEYMKEIRPTLEKQIVNSVMWEQCVEKMINDGVDTFIEIGPSKTLSSFIKKINKDMKVFNVSDIESLSKLESEII